MFGLEQLLKVLDPVSVTVDHQACLRARHKRSACRSCSEVCPDQAVNFADGKITVDPDKCSRCSLCAGACPTAAMTVRGVDEQAVLAASQVRCSKTAGTGLEIPCLGWLTTDHLTAMGLRHEAVELLSGDCQACVWQKGGQLTEVAATTANAVLSVLKPAARITLGRRTAAAEPLDERVLSRRELFTLWRVEGVQVAKQLVPVADVNPARLPARVPVRRGAWVKQVQPEGVPPEALMPDGPWKARVMSDRCSGCGICVAFCPTGALVQASEGADWNLTHQAAACVDCGTCVSLCPVKAVGEEPLTAQQLAAGQARELARLSTARCPSCRKEFKGRPDETHCPQCRATFGMLQC